jgi:hypothetical protein
MPPTSSVDKRRTVDIMKRMKMSSCRESVRELQVFYLQKRKNDLNRVLKPIEVSLKNNYSP